MSQPYVSGTFCDDVRREDNGKLLLIGCYNSNMIVREFPFTPARLCLHFNVIFRTESAPQKVVVTVKKDGEKMIGFEMGVDTPPDQSPLSSIGGGLDLPPTQYDKPALIETEFELDNVIHQGPSLYIETGNLPPLGQVEIKADN